MPVDLNDTAVAGNLKRTRIGNVPDDAKISAVQVDRTRVVEF